VGDAGERGVSDAQTPVNRGVYLLKLQASTRSTPATRKWRLPSSCSRWNGARRSTRHARQGDECAGCLSDDLRATHRRIEAQLVELIDRARDFMAASERAQLRFMDKLIAEIGDCTKNRSC